MKLRDFDHRLALVQSKFRVGQAGRNHGYGAVVTESQEGARCQKNLRLTNLRIERLARLQFRRTDRCGVEELPCDRGLSFDIIQTSWACWVWAKSWRRQSRSQDDACYTCDQSRLPHNFHLYTIGCQAFNARYSARRKNTFFA